MRGCSNNDGRRVSKEDPPLAVQSIHVSESVLNAALDALSAHIAVLDASGSIVAVNAAWQRFAKANGLADTNSVGVNYLAVCDAAAADHDAARAAIGIRAVLAGQRDQITLEYPCHSPDQQRWFILRATPFCSDNSRYAVVAHEDITRRRLAEQSLQESQTLLEQRVKDRTRELAAANDQLQRENSERRRTEAALRIAKNQAERADEAKSRFLAATSHDLRQPLQTIAALQAVLARTVKEPAAQKPLTTLRDTVRAMDSILNTLLDINQLETGEITPVITDFPVARLLSQLRADFSLVAKNKGLALRVVPSRAWLRCDPELLLQILRNLVNNAIKYTEQGKVLVGCRRVKNHLRIDVLDTGLGIPADRQRLVFEAFYQLNNPARDRRQGLGLGLAIIDRLAKLLGLELAMRSIPGKGTQFGVSVPLGRVEPGFVQAPAVESGREPAAATLLYIEDDPAVLDAMQMLLRLEGFTVVPARGAEEALRHVIDDGRWPDLILADYRLPNGKTGVETVQQVRQALDRAIPAIIITGDLANGQVSQAEALGYVVLYKPVDSAQLLQTIRQRLADVE